MSTRRLKVASVQHACTADREENLARSIAGIREAHAAGAKLVLLQELHTSLYFPQIESAGYFDLAEPIPGPSTETLSALAAELQMVIVASLFERRGAGLYHNTAVVLDQDGSLAGMYRKMHIPDDPGFYEKYYFTPGDLGFTPIQTSVGRLGLLVCWDQWFPEAARLMALAGAEVLLYPTAIGWDPADSDEEQQRQREAWQIIQRSHAVANNLPVIVNNRCGFEAHPHEDTGIQFWGSGFICGPQGEMLASSSETGDGVICAELDLAQTETVRRTWPYLRDRRIDAYAGLQKRYLDEQAE